MEDKAKTDFVKIIELNKNEKLIENITNLLKENNIKYKLDLEEHWTIPYKYSKYIPKFSICVEKDFEEQAKKIIEAFVETGTTEDESLLEENQNDPTEIQSKKVKIFKKISIAVFLLLVLTLFLTIMFYNVFHKNKRRCIHLLLFL